MKRTLILILAFGMLLGLSTAAYAADQITNVKIYAGVESDSRKDITSNPSQKINYNGTVEITGEIPADRSSFSASMGTVRHPTNTTFSLSLNAKDLSSSGAVTLTLMDKDNEFSNWQNTFSVAAKPEFTGPPSITCSKGHNLTVSGSGTSYTCAVPNTCVAGHTLTINANAHYESPRMQPSNTIDAGNFTGSITYTLTAYNENKEETTYSLNLTKEAPKSSEAKITSLAIKEGSSAVGSITNSTNNTTEANAAAFNITTSSTGYLTLSPSLSAGASFKAYSPFTSSSNIANQGLNFPNVNTAYNLRIEVTAEDGVSKKDYYFKITRISSGSTQLLDSISLQSGSKNILTTSSGIGSLTTTDTSKSYTISSTYVDTSSATLSWTKPSNVTITSATWDGTTFSSKTNLAKTSFSGTLSLPSAGSSKNLVLKFTVGSSSTVYTTTITITKPSSTTSSSTALSSLYFKDRVTTSTSSSYLFNTNQSFSSSRTAYTVTVPTSEDTLYLYYTKSNSNATVSTSGGSRWNSENTSANNNTTYYKVTLKNGSQTLYLSVNLSGYSSTTYTITVNRNDDDDDDDKTTNVTQNASLSGLNVRQTSSSSSTRYSLSPSFAYNKLKYEVDLDNSLDEVYLHFTPQKSSATVTVSSSGTTKISENSGTYVYRVSLSSNSTRTVTIKVSYGGNSETYTLSLNQGNSSSTNALLRSLTVTPKASSSNPFYLLPNFDAAVKDYLVLIPYADATDEVYIRAQLENSSHTLKMNNSTKSSGNYVPFTLEPGDDTSVVIKVTNSSNQSNSYMVTLVTARKNADSNANLGSLSLYPGSTTSSSLSLSPAFSAYTTTYDTTISSDQNNLRLYAAPEDSDGWILVNGQLLRGSYVDLSLSSGKNTIKVEVFAEDCETSKTYTIYVDRGSSSNNTGFDASLSGLTLRTNTNQLISLTPSFNKGTYYYRASVPDNVTQISFLPTATDKNATIKLLGQVVTSNQWSSNQLLNSRDNIFTFTVTSSDQNTALNYHVTVERGLSVVVSDQNLEVNGRDIPTAAYNINDYNYFMLRDIAYSLRGTGKNFHVSYDQGTRTIHLTSGRDYTVVGAELLKPSAAQETVLSTQRIMLDGQLINLVAYNINGYNYFKLRDVAECFDFGLSYDEDTRTMGIHTSQSYISE